MAKFLAALVAIFLSGCGLPAVDSISISDDFSEEERELVLEGLQMWCDADPGLCFPMVESGASVQIRPAKNCSKGKLGTTEKNRGLDGATDIRVCPQDSWKIPATVSHEFGHALGADHLPRGNVMSTTLEEFPWEVTILDIGSVL